jgi:hypothetical protein
MPGPSASGPWEGEWTCMGMRRRGSGNLNRHRFSAIGRMIGYAGGAVFGAAAGGVLDLF